MAESNCLVPDDQEAGLGISTNEEGPETGYSIQGHMSMTHPDISISMVYQSTRYLLIQ